MQSLIKNGGGNLIIYNKLGDYLKAKNMKWIDLQNALGISPSVMAKFQKNRSVTTDTIDKVCTYLHIQPSDMMEWVENEDTLKEREIQAQIDALQKQLADLKKQNQYHNQRNPKHLTFVRCYFYAKKSNRKENK